MSLGDSLRDSEVWHRRCADVIDSISSSWLGETTGSLNVFAAEPPVGFKIVRLIDGQRFRFRPNHTIDNGGGATLEVSGVAAKGIVRPDGSNLQAGDITNDVVAEVQYDEPNNKFVLVDIPLSEDDFSASPGVASGGSSDATTLYAYYQKRGRWVTIAVAFSITTGGTPAYLTITLPFASANLGFNQNTMGTCQDPTTVPAFFSVQNNSQECRIARSDLANFGTGAGRGGYALFTYLAA